MKGILQAADYTDLTLDDVVNEIEVIRYLAGSRHVALGPDYFGLQASNSSWVEGGRWRDNVAENVAAMMCARGFYKDEIRDVLGRNLAELYEAVWTGKARPHRKAAEER